MTVTLQHLTREAEFLEKTFFYCEQNKLFRCVSISAKLNHKLEENAVYESLRQLVLKYPLLFSRIEGSGNNVRYLPLEEIRFDDVYSVNSEVDLCFKDDEKADTRILTDVSFWQNHLNKTALWKLVYYEKTGWLTFHSAHCFTDGGSVVVYLKEFVEGLNHVKKGVKREILFNLNADLPILKHGISPGFFDCVKFQPGLGTRIFFSVIKSAIAIWPGIIPNVLEKKRYESFFIDRPPEPFSTERCFESSYVIDEESGLNFTQAMFLNFDSKQVKTMLEACRANKVKLQSFILLVHAHTINELYPELYATKNLKTGVAASFRNQFQNLQTHNSYLGNEGRFDDGFYTYAATFLLEPGTKFSWEVVRKYHDFLHKKIGGEEWINQYYIAQAMTAENYLDHRVGKAKDDLFLSSTNLGHIDLLQYDDTAKYQIEDILFAPSAGALLGTHHMTISSTSKNGLNIGITNADPNIKDWVEFKNALRKNMLLFSQG